MKKYLIAISLLVALLISVAYLGLIRRQVSYHKVLSASTGRVVILENFDQSNVRIVITDKDEIEVNLKGSDDDIEGLVLNEDGLFARFGISSDFSDLSGTISVPAGTLIDVTLSGENQINVDENGDYSDFTSNSFLVDTTNLNSLEFSSGGSIKLDSWGDLIVWDDETWNLIDDSSVDSESDNSEDSAYCGIGSQAVRDYCCVLQNLEASAPVCNGDSYFVFDNVQRDCAFRCDLTEENENGEAEGVDDPVDCGLGGQSQRNACCAEQHIGEYQGCLGSWNYNNAASDCEFECNIFDQTDDPQSDDEDIVIFDDPVSTFCHSINDPEERNLCCNDAKGNALSSGPNTGYPDCIGKWFFDEETGCQFQCADYVDMIQILNEIRQNSQQP